MTPRTPTEPGPTRREHDLIGDIDVPASAYWGAHTARAVENFPISGVTLASQPYFVTALATVKQAAAIANRDVGELPTTLADAIVAACEEIRGGALLDQFVVDLIQGGAGTSTNMNVNEVVANRALEHLGRPRGAYQSLHPLEHVNHRAEHERRLPDRDQARPGQPHSGPARRARHAARGLRREGRRVRGRPQDGPHPAAGRRAHDAGPGVRGLRGDPRRGRAAPRRGSPAAARAQPRRHRHRHRAERPPRVPRPGRGRAAPADRHRDPDLRRRSGRGHRGRRGVRAALRGAQARRGEAVQDLQRPAAALLRAARRTSTRSTCRPARPARRSCRARSTRSSPRWSTRSPSK